MKYLAIGAIALVTLAYFNRKRFRFLASDGLRVFLVLIGVGVLIALSYGPPKYVLLEDSVRTLQVNGQDTRAYQGWKINRLLPFEAFATEVFYAPEYDHSEPLSDMGMAPLSDTFEVPGHPVSRFLWGILLLALLAALVLIPKIRKQMEAKESLQRTQAWDTVHAYDQFIARYRKGFLRPRSLVKQARQKREHVYKRYIRRVIVMQALNDRNIRAAEMALVTDGTSEPERQQQQGLINNRRSYASLLETLTTMLEHGRDCGRPEIPFRLEIAPGFFSADFQTKYDDTKALFEAATEIDERRWSELRSPLGLPDMETILAGYKDEMAAASSRLRHHSWKEVNELREAITSLVESTANPAEENLPRAGDQIASAKFAINDYLLCHFALQLPLSSAYGNYRKKYDAALGDMLLKSLNRFFPDEQDTDGKPAMFRFWSDSTHSNSLKVTLAYNGSVMSSGQLPANARFTFCENGNPKTSRYGQPSKSANAATDKRPVMDAVYNCVTAFTPPAMPGANRRVIIPESASALRRILKELDDMVTEYGKDMAKDELKSYLYEQLPDEVEQVANELNQMLDAQLNDMADHAIELAGSILDLLLQAGQTEE